MIKASLEGTKRNCSVIFGIKFFATIVEGYSNAKCHIRERENICYLLLNGEGTNLSHNRILIRRM
jgi:hypothetical protein